MARNEVFTTNKVEFINIAALIILVIFVWLNLRALIIDIGITLIAFIGGINYINKFMSQVRLTDEEISYRHCQKKKH